MGHNVVTPYFRRKTFQSMRQ